MSSIAIEEPLAAARTALAAGRLTEAEAACEARLAQQAADPRALHLLALVRFRCGRGEEALRLLERALRADPALVAVQSDLGAMQVMLGHPEAALAPLRAALALDAGHIEARTNLGNALHACGELEAAEAEYRRAVAADAHHGRANLSLGNLLVQLRRPAEALPFLEAARATAPESAAVHAFLGNGLRDAGRVEEAVASYRRAIALEPGQAEASESLGLMLKNGTDYAEALPLLRASGKPYAHAQALECLLRLGRHEEFFEEIRGHSEAEATNLHSASLAAYASWHLGRRDPHPFCPDPLQRVRVMDVYTGVGADQAFLQDLIREASQVTAIWEPRGVTTIGGFQTGGNLFRHGFPALARLERDILAGLERYRAALMPTSMTMITRWPGTLRLQGWFVRLLTGGHQHFHNHPFGWMSGCLYLQLPQRAAAGEGAIEFGLESGAYPRLSERPSPTLLHQPKPGQIAFFPSSLYHRTIPFRSDEERLCIAFDLLPP
ncbi:MAG: tetratricopeptide repeat protein [Gammaproteobacteria bacterium]|nr:tetratricopeptide repeat protein [Gammaproteobacteria bacterium]QOJ32031.1 MAG: tetratricopeptide repeat protein [Gammaproteobacteria bacterium]